MTARGFSLVELLVALVICAVASSLVAIIVPPARTIFETTPAAIELQQRGRTTIELVTQAIRGAGGNAVAAEGLGPLSSIVPAVIPYDQIDGRFRRLKVVMPAADGAQGVLDRHQEGGNGALSLGPERCANVPLVCGFSRDVTALIADGSGRFDAFTVAAADAAASQITAVRALVPPYVAGSIVLEGDVFKLQLETQPDGSQTLVRITAAGAVQPIADRVTHLSFEPFTWDEAGSLVPLPAEALTDGPWLRGEPDGTFDEDVFRIRRIDVVLSMSASPPSSAQQSFRFGVSLRNTP
jgi:prepilin-type N-terminal cleavage/methylation domain-containing protein